MPCTALSCFRCSAALETCDSADGETDRAGSAQHDEDRAGAGGLSPGGRPLRSTRLRLRAQSPRLRLLLEREPRPQAPQVCPLRRVPGAGAGEGGRRERRDADRYEPNRDEATGMPHRFTGGANLSRTERHPRPLLPQLNTEVNG
jgi:hypothetical protein